MPSVTLVGFRPQVRVVLDTPAERLTGPTKPFTVLTVIVEVPDELRLNVTLVGLAVKVKPGCAVIGGFTVTVTVAEWRMPPLVPVTLTLYVPAGVIEVVAIVRVEVVLPPERLTTDGLSDRVGPPETDGEIVAARFTPPVKPFVALTVTVDILVAPAVTDTVVGLAETEKSSFENFQPVKGWISQWPGLVPLSKNTNP